MVHMGLSMQMAMRLPAWRDSIDNTDGVDGVDGDFDDDIEESRIDQLAQFTTC